MLKYSICLTLACIMLNACHNAESATHDHHAHNHGGHDAHGHNHSHNNNHNHNHNHTQAKPAAHDHAAEAAENPDVIFLPVAKAKEIGITSTTVQPKAFKKVIPATGRIELAQNAEHVVIAPVSGVVRLQRAWTQGYAVKAGDVCLNISSNQMIDGDPVAMAKVAYETALSDFQRAERLIKNQLIAQSEYNAIKERYEKAKIAFEGVAHKQNQEGTAVQASVSGYVSECLVQDGAYVERGQALMKVIKTDAYYLHADVSQRYFSELKHIASANFTTIYDHKVYELEAMNGKLVSYGKQCDPNTNFIPVTFSFTPQEALLPGTCVEVELLSQSTTQALTLPLSALTEEQGLYFVYIQLCSETYTKREVLIGANNGIEVEIIKGLKTGEKVVTHGAYHIKLASMNNAIPGHSHEH
ncbi:MAG: efflux RND transporter periplasmic adaptor subunit [Bacteroidaceae bacterium]|nr:efflux RND transporter periplasmic adaptor subunit [Bacteroidaceae bacterium]